MNWQRVVDTYRGHTVPHFKLVEHRNWWFAASAVVIVISLVGLVFVRLNYSIDFTGGAKLTFPLRSDATVADFQSTMESFGFAEPEVQIATGPDGTSVSIRTEALETAPAPAVTPSPGTASVDATATATTTPTATASGSGGGSATASASTSETAGPAPGTTSALLLNALAKQAGVAYNEINVESIGPTWGSEISKKALRGLLLVLVAIALYIAMRFEWKMAIGAMIALIHDIVITAGVYALVGREVTPETVIAILTILGFSLYDTVVIYDKIKENTESTALIARHGYSGVVNLSLNQTLMRSVNTSLVVLLPILSLMLFGGATLKDFAIAMFIGVATGAYSSIFIAAPVLTVLKGREKRYRQIEARVAAKQAPAPRTAVVATSEVAASGATARTSASRPRPKSNKRPRAKRKRR
jgi:preprotein translocase subunit SecF